MTVTRPHGSTLIEVLMVLVMASVLAKAPVSINWNSKRVALRMA